MLGFFGFQILFTADTLFVKAYFTGKETGFYLSAGTLARALMWLVGPLAAVMFPRLVHSAAKAQKTDLMGIVLLGTGCWPWSGGKLVRARPWLVRIVWKQSYVQVATSVLPWYASAMVPWPWPTCCSTICSLVLLPRELLRCAFSLWLWPTPWP